MSKPDKTRQTLTRVAIIAVVVAGLSAGGAALIAQAQNAPAKATDTTTSVNRTSLTHVAASPPIEEMQPDNSLKAATFQGTDAATVAPAATTARPTDTARPAFFGDRVAGQPVLLRRPMAPAKVDWQAATNRAAIMSKQVRPTNGLRARLPRAELDKTLLPVVLPREGGLVDTAKARMMSFGDAYALNMPQTARKGTQITVYGNRTFVPTDSGAISKRPVARLAGVPEDIRISQMEDGWTATFSRYGVVYSIDVSCDSIESDDCKTDTYIRNVVSQMDDVTMGAQAQDEANRSIKQDSSWLNQVSRTITNITRGG